jgi:hypothetical protein
MSIEKGKGFSEKRHDEVEKYDAWEWKTVQDNEFIKQIIDCLDDTGDI